MKISVIIPSYNHEKFVADAIQSVLDQTFQDFEIIITDDGSSDNTVEEIKKFKDPRIKLSEFSENKGAYFSVENCLKYASGEYIAILSSDDMFLPDKLEKQVKFLDENDQYAAVFGFAQIIDEEGHDFTDEDHFYSNIFVQENRDRFEWLRKFFYEGNFLCHPSVLIRKEFYTIDQFDPRYRQLPDFDFWIKLCMKSEIYILQENLIKFRVLDNDANTSASNIKNHIRSQFEYAQILKLYLDLGKKEFINIFEKKYGTIDEIEIDLIPFYLAMEAFETDLPSHYKFAIQELYNILGHSKIRKKIQLKYEFTLNKYFTMCANDKQIIELNKQVNLKDTQVIELNQQVNRKDAQVIELNHLAHTQQNMIDTLNTLLLQEDIDISIVTYNSKKWADTFFESLLQQKYPLHKLHIYITDNSSTDDTYTYLQGLKANYSQVFGCFDLKQEKNLGFGFGHNNNFKRSKSKFVLATNIDLEFEADAICNLVNYAQQDDDITASWEMRQKPYEHPKYYNPITLETTWSSSACILFRKEAIDKIGGYDDHIFMYGEDVELSYRLRDNGYKLKYYPKAVCWHYTYAEAGQIKEVQYFGSTIANILIRMRYGSKTEVKEGLRMYKALLNAQGLIYNQRRKQLMYLLKLIYKAPFFLLNRKKRRDITYKFINWDYEFIRDGAFYSYNEDKLSETPLVSVIMRTCCERNGFLKEAVQSVINQTYNNIELIIVEDGTKEASPVVKAIQADNITNVIYTPIEKAGRCHAGNEGLAVANGKYMIFLDDDDLFFADHLEVLVNELETNPDIAACYSSSFEVKTDIISKNPLVYKEKEFTVVHKEEFSRETMLHHNFIPIQSILFKRELYDEYGGFDEELDNLEDWSLWTRYSYLNDFKFIDKTTSLYRVPSCAVVSEKRQNELDRYYKIAVQKQQEFIASLGNQGISKI